MAFDFSTLVTDRTQADVAAQNDKGTYNATDLNRVDVALEDLAARFRAAGYALPTYQRVLVHKSPRRLPDGYTQLEYIQSSGTQYIDTGAKPNQNYTLKIKFQTTQSSSGGIAVCDQGWQLNGFGIWCNAAEFGDQTVQSLTLYGADPIEAALSQSGLVVNGEQVWTPTTATFTVPASMTLMALNRNGSIAEKLSGKLYYAQLYSGNTLIRDFYPCIDASGNVGLYDLENGQFYGNNGTGSFAAGQEISQPVPIPPYTWIEADIPTASQMAQRLTNVSAVRKAVKAMETTPATPESMALLNYIKANDIEQILIDLDFLFINMTQAWFFSGDLYAGET